MTNIIQMHTITAIKDGNDVRMTVATEDGIPFDFCVRIKAAPEELQGVARKTQIGDMPQCGGIAGMVQQLMAKYLGQI